MRNPLPFDTHSYVKRLVAAGMPEAQAEVQADALAEFVLSQLATKDDLNQAVERIRSEMKAELSEVRGEIAEVRGEIAEVRGEIAEARGEIRESELRLTARLESELRKQMVWFFGFLVLWTGALAGILRLLLPHP